MCRTNSLLFVFVVALGLFVMFERPGTAVLFQNAPAGRPQLVLQTGHTSGVNSIAFAPDGSWLASSGADNSIIIWQTSSGKQLRVFKGHKVYVRSLAISSDGQWLASGSNDRTIKIWEVDSGREVFTLDKHTGPVVSLAFSSDGRWLASGSLDKTIKIWDLKTRSDVQTLIKHTAPLSVLAFNSSASALISAANTEVIVWDTKTWRDKQKFRRMTATVTALAIDDDENTIASASSDGSVLLWRIGSDRERFVFKQNPSSVVALTFRNNALIAIHSDGGIDAWDSEKGSQKQSVSGDANRQQLTFAVCNNDGSIFASTTGDRVLSTRNSATGEVIHNFESHATAINSIAVSADGRWFASAANDSSVRLWQVATGRELPRLMGHAGYVTTVVFSPDSNFLASGSRSGEVKIWDVNSTQLAYSLPSHTNGVNSVAFSSNGKLLAVVGMDHKVEVWNLEKKQARTFVGHSNEITSAVFAKDFLVTAGRDKTIRTWDVNTGANLKSVETPSEINGIAINPNGDLLATANVDSTIRTWDIETLSLKRTFAGHTAEAFAVRFSPNGNSLISASADRTTFVWELETRDPVKQLRGNIDTVSSVAYSSNGDWILTGSDDGTIRVWEASTGQLTATLVSVPDSDDWLVATPDGLFDGSPESWHLMLWRFEQGTFKVVPVEAYFNEFYYPSVLAEILAGQKPKAIEDIAQKDRRQPLIALRAPANSTSRNLDIEVVLSAAAPDNEHPNDSGARDLRLFRNGLMVRRWTGDLLGNSKSITIQTTVPIVEGENRFTAYAFNRDNVKSADAVMVLKGASSLKRDRTAYVLAIGIDDYTNANYALNYAVADAKAFGAELKARMPTKVQVVPLYNKDATKENILLALKLFGDDATVRQVPENAPPSMALIKRAQPEDILILFFAGHGTARENQFYLIPHDLGYDGSQQISSDESKRLLLEHSISDRELEAAFEKVDVAHLLLVIDACNSGQALEAEEKRRGPMNAKGLAQLAYEKGMYVLAAAQSYQAAREVSELGHGLLTFVLVEEGLKTMKANRNEDSRLTAREWFDYATRRVPNKQLEKMKQRSTEIRNGTAQKARSSELVFQEGDKREVQRPRVFYRREMEQNELVVAERYSGP